MSTVIGPLYHWSPTERRTKIKRNGLRASTPTLVETFADEPTGKRKLLASVGNETVPAVCLGTSPSHAWALSGAIWADRGDNWDLWQVNLDQHDLTVMLPSECGYRIGEIRVCNDIPKDRIWLVGQRVVAQKWTSGICG